MIAETATDPELPMLTPRTSTVASPVPNPMMNATPFYGNRRNDT